jgi:HD-GYP domain-containing protein (c-di-GMP phosphodiesterase class II)
VADFFEAITSKRHYREPMPLDTAFELLMDKSDIHFDRRIVEALMRYYKKTEKKKFLTTHHI